MTEPVPAGVVLHLVPVKTASDPGGPTLVLHEGNHRLGRAEDNDFVLAAPGVAPYHCKILIGGSQVAILRLDSSAVLSQNGRPVTGAKPAPVLSGDRIALGSRLFRAQLLKKSTSGNTAVRPNPAGAVADPARMPDIGAEFAGCRLEEVVGQGGTAMVYRAVRLDNNRMVALKVLRAGQSFSTGAAVRFYREAMVGGMLASHPVAVAILEIGRCDPYSYIAMEYVNGVDVQRVLDQKGKLPTRQALDIVLPVVDLLRFAATSKLIHRDIKPGNIMVCADGTVKLLDLGLAREEGPKDGYELTQPSQGFGTLSFVAPEQAFDAGSVDFRADIYALAATLFMMLTGRPPLEVQTPSEFLKKVIKEGAPRLRTVDPSQPEAVDAVLARCLKTDRDQRYQSYEELLRDLQAARESLG